MRSTAASRSTWSSVVPETATIETKFLQNLWDDREAAALEDRPLDLLRYRSNLLGADLRITNFGGGNTSSKFELPDPLTGEPTPVLAVKGSGGDLRSIGPSGFAILYLDKLLSLAGRYRGDAHEDEMVGFYPLIAFGENRVAASIDTPLHAFLPFPHVDHLHPDWAIALAASCNGRAKTEEFNRRFGHRLVWVPWQRPGFELALMLREAVDGHLGCDGIVLGGHGLFTWGETARECYRSSLTVIDRLGEFVVEHEERLGERLFGGPKFETRGDADDVAAAILPCLRGRIGSRRRVIGHYSRAPEVLRFVNSRDAAPLAGLGTSCPDHFIRTKLCPLLVDWNPGAEDLDRLKQKIAAGIESYRKDYEAYYASFAGADSPPLRDPSPAVVLIPGVGMFTFGRDKQQARVTGEFYCNAIRVMAGATALGDGSTPQDDFPQARRREDSARFSSYSNYVALPRGEAFRIEYWELEEAKLRRQAPERELSRRVFLVVGGGSGIGLATVARMAERGAHVVVADRDGEAARAAAERLAGPGSKEAVAHCVVDLRSRPSLAAALRRTLLEFGGLDGIV